MQTILHIVRKEFLQIIRNKQLLPFMTVVPMMQIIMLSFAANYEIQHISLTVWNNDGSPQAQKLVESFVGSGFFTADYVVYSQKQADSLLFADATDVVLVIPEHFERNLMHAQTPTVQLQVNAMNNAKAGVITAYSSEILSSFGVKFIQENRPQLAGNRSSSISPVVNYWYNPLLNYKTIMVPGILAEIVTLIALLLSALNIVREKEIGTIEQLNVTPLKKHHFIIGKLLPFGIIGHGIFWVGLLLGTTVFSIEIVGNPLVLEAFIFVYMTVPLGFGLLISTMANTQQQALFTSFFFIIIFILMCGLFTPLETMPQWAQYVNYINPMMYFVEVARLVVLKGSSFQEILPYIFAMFVYGLIVNGLAVIRYKKYK